ncbi:ADP-ribosylation factor-like protein 6 [Leguminivora glycinivorella]|uniref:ADP-ribosylation factor-like protein 6 n=1 Tax=Leguminivora glycinivorella TaxID=1035111 RepID=UPI00200F65D5|nr:ADP-ribosylation factor-like protein 6 [Leguminivora glycinivorella]
MGLMDAISSWLGGRTRVSAPVLVLGLDRAGKTSLLRALRPPDPAGAPPPAQLQPNVEHFQSGGVSFSAWDVSGAARARALWERHYRRAQAVIFVVDAADHLRLVVAREELELVLAHPDMSGRRIPLLVLANKSDAAGALPPDRLAVALCLERVQDRPWHVCATSARDTNSIHDGIAWLARQVREIHTPARDH